MKEEKKKTPKAGGGDDDDDDEEDDDDDDDRFKILILVSAYTVSLGNIFYSEAKTRAAVLWDCLLRWSGWG